MIFLHYDKIIILKIIIVYKVLVNTLIQVNI
jgi:hypothetical protein